MSQKYENIFSELGRNPTPVEVGPHGKVPISSPILDFVKKIKNINSGREIAHCQLGVQGTTIIFMVLFPPPPRQL